MGILRKIYPVILSVFLTGCYEDFNPRVDIEPVICLNSLITAGEPIELSVTHSWLYTDESGENNHQVDDATISILVNGTKVDNTYLPHEGDTVKITADSPTYGYAEAAVVVPFSVPITSLKWESVITDKWEYGESCILSMNLNAKMTISDQADTENYYQFTYQGFPEKEDSDPGVTIYTPMRFYPGTFCYEAEPIFSEHIGELDAISGSDSFGFTFFTDRQFTGKTYTLNLQFNDMIYELRELGTLEEDDDLLNCGLVLTLNTVSRSYYNWCNYQWNIENGSIGELGSVGMSDPVWGYSNVSTGAGVVAAQSQASYTINLKDFLKQNLTSTNQ